MEWANGCLYKWFYLDSCLLGLGMRIMKMQLIAFADVLFYKYLAGSTIDHFIYVKLN